MNIANTIKTATLNTAFHYLEKNPEENALKLLTWVDRLAGDGPESFEMCIRDRASYFIFLSPFKA